MAKRIRATAEAKLDPEWERACAMANDLKSKDGTVLWALSFCFGEMDDKYSVQCKQNF